MKTTNNFQMNIHIDGTIYFDLDGTVADLYAVDNWLDKLRAFDPSPYEEAEPIGNLIEICELLSIWQAFGGKVGVISWCSKESTKEYDKAIRQAKKEWLKEFMPIKFDEMHIVKYGTPKQYVAKDKDGILFDDEEKNRNNWKGQSFDPITNDIAEIIAEILKNKGLLP